MDEQLTTIYLVRHGETELNRRGIYQGTIDAPLNERGFFQAQALARQLAHVSFDAAYSSPLKRALATADQIVAARPQTIHIVDALRELSYGAWQGLTPADREREDAALSAQWAAAPWSVQFPEGESLAQLSARATAAWDDIVARHRGQTVLVSAHGHVNRIILMHALGWSHGQFWEIEQPNGGVAQIVFDGTDARHIPMPVADFAVA
jgi:broad specificity phosphatase PhoE